MRKQIPVIALAMIATAIVAAPDRQILTVTTGTNAAATVTATSTTLRGYIEEITFDVVTAGTTGTLSVVAAPELSTLANTTLASVTDCDTDTTVRPRFDPTTTGGETLTNNPAYTFYRYMAVGDSIQFAVTNASATGAVFKCVIKYDR